ncbi:MAG: YmdB family metallophosphoesterase, partial [Bacteroidota bacterium]
DICKELFSLGVDAITTGNHVWAQKQILSYISQEKRVLRPLNYPQGTPGAGFTLLEKPGHKPTLVINVMARLFMEPFLDDPFKVCDQLLERFRLGQNVGMIIVDIHGEATSEKISFANYFDGRVSMVFGTHTHVPTSDARILPKGTAYQTDLGMCGDYNSVLGMKIETAIPKFIRKGCLEKLSVSLGDGTIAGVLMDSQNNCLAASINPVIVGPVLKNLLP